MAQCLTCNRHLVNVGGGCGEAVGGGDKAMPTEQRGGVTCLSATAELLLALSLLILWPISMERREPERHGLDAIYRLPNPRKSAHQVMLAVRSLAGSDVCNWTLTSVLGQVFSPRRTNQEIKAKEVQLQVQAATVDRQPNKIRSPLLQSLAYLSFCD